MKRLMVVSMMFLLLAGPLAGLAYPMPDEDRDHAMAETTGSATLESLKASPSKAADGTISMNNELCPVSGDKTDPKSVITQDGVTYRMCCGMCASKIQKNPGKYTVPKSVVVAKIGGYEEGYLVIPSHSYAFSDLFFYAGDCLFGGLSFFQKDRV